MKSEVKKATLLFIFSRFPETSRHISVSRRVTPSLPMIFSPSVSLSFSFSGAELRNTVKGPKNTSTPAKRGEEKKQHCKLLQREISPPLQPSTSSSVKPFMKVISLRAALHGSFTLLNIPCFIPPPLYLSHT